VAVIKEAENSKEREDAPAWNFAWPAVRDRKKKDARAISDVTPAAKKNQTANKPSLSGQ